MLGACQRRPATVAGKPEEIFGHQRYRAPRAPLPRRVSRRIDDNLTHDSPTRMVRIAARNEEPGQRLGYPHSSGLGPVTVQVPQCGTHISAALDRPGELPGRPPRLCVVHHRSLHRTRAEGRAPCWLQLASNHPKVGDRVPGAGAEADRAARRRADWNESGGRPTAGPGRSHSAKEIVPIGPWLADARNRGRPEALASTARTQARRAGHRRATRAAYMHGSAWPAAPAGPPPDDEKRGRSRGR